MKSFMLESSKRPRRWWKRIWLHTRTESVHTISESTNSPIWWETNLKERFTDYQKTYFQTQDEYAKFLMSPETAKARREFFENMTGWSEQCDIQWKKWHFSYSSDKQWSGFHSSVSCLPRIIRLEKDYKIHRSKKSGSNLYISVRNIWHGIWMNC